MKKRAINPKGLTSISIYPTRVATLLPPQGFFSFFHYKHKIKYTSSPSKQTISAPSSFHPSFCQLPSNPRRRRRSPRFPGGFRRIFRPSHNISSENLQSEEERVKSESKAMMMEQRPSLYPCFAGVSDLELEVAEILIQIPDIMISQLAAAETPATVLRRCLSWGYKRKRMDRGGEKRKRMNNGGGEASNGFLTKPEDLPATTAAAVQVESLSPNTPLEFEPSESDYKGQSSQKVAAGRREREKWWGEIERLIEEKESIEIEVNKVKRHRDNLMARNLQLKHRKEELMRLNQKKEETPCLEINPSLKQQVVVPFCQQPAQPTVISPQYQQQPIHAPPSVMFYQHPRPHIMHQTAHIQTRQINDTLGVRIATMFNCNSISGRRDRFDIKMEDFFHGWVLYGPNGCNISVEEACRLLKKKLVWTPTKEELEVMSKFAPKNRAQRLEILRVKKSRYHSR